MAARPHKQPIDVQEKYLVQEALLSCLRYVDSHRAATVELLSELLPEHVRLLAAMEVIVEHVLLTIRKMEDRGSPTT